MNFEVIEHLVTNIILIIFPILIYFVVMCYKEKVTRDYDDLILNLSLITSLYLCLRFGTMLNNNKMLLFCNIPIVIAYIKKRPNTAIILSLANILYCYFICDAFYAITIIKYLSYFILYLCAEKRRLSSDGFILSVAILQGFFLSFEYFFHENIVTISEVIEVFLLVFLYYFLTFFILYVFKLIEKIRKLNDSIEQLEKEKKIKNALFKLTHEIKNPLAVCKGYLEMIDLDQKNKSEKYLSIMKQEIDRSLNIMTDFMEFNKIKIVKQPIDLNLLLDDVYDCLKIIVKSKNIKLNYDSKDEEVYFMGDYDRLKQVLINLLKNSVESIEGKGTITLSNHYDKNNVYIIVADTGSGMDKEDLKKLTELFYTTKKNGSGLGVALSNEIITSHNGTLKYESELNKGTKAIIKLPYN